MNPAYRVPSLLNHSFPQARQRKVVMQRQYREKEGEYMNTLRDVIKELTGQELHTRKDILNKAIDLLSAISEIKGQSKAQAIHVHPARCEINGTAEWGNFTQSLASYGHESQTWQFNTEPYYDAPSDYYTTALNDCILMSKVLFQESGDLTQSHDQQYYIMSSMNLA